MLALDTVEKLLCERYNVAAPPEGAVANALAAARVGNLTPLRELVAERELYRYRAPIEAALATLDDPAPEAEAAESEEPVPPRRRTLSDLKLNELMKLTEANKIEVPEGARKKDVAALLRKGKVVVPDEMAILSPGSDEPEGRAVGADLAAHLVEGHLDEAWLAIEWDIEQLKELAGEWELQVADDATAADIAKLIAAEKVYFDPNDGN